MFFNKRSKKMKQSKIQERIELAKVLRQGENASKPERCLLCQKQLTKHCNSHVVPRFILDQISEEGKVSYGATFYTPLNDVIDTTTGVNNAFTFKMICKDCDSKRFSKYENPEMILNFDNLSIEEQKEILLEIAIKNHISHIWMKKNTYERNNVFFSLESQIIKFTGFKTAYEIDIVEHLKDIKEISKFKDRKSFPFKIVYNKLLDFKTNIATQTLLSYVYDLKGKLIFNRRDFRERNKGRYFYLAIFPYQEKTRVLFYIKKQDESLVKSILDDFDNLTEEDKLHFIFISLITLSEQFYINPKLAKVMKKDRRFVRLYIKTDGILDNWRYCKKIKKFKKYKNYLINNLNDTKK